MGKLFRKFRILFPSIFLVFIFAFAGIVLAQTATPTPSPTPTPESSSSSDSNICTSVQECADQKLDCSKCIEYLASKKSEASGKAKTLSSEIAVTNSQIKLTEARIRATEQKIKELQKDIGIAKDKIEDLESVIDRATRLLIERIVAVYQVGRLEPWQIFLTARNIDDVFSRLKYLRIVQIYDKIQVYAAEQAKTDYKNQKEIFEDKEGEAEALSKKLDDYNNQLESEKGAKASLLAVTRNDESRYQQLLARARAEYEAILGIIGGRGSEVEVGLVSEGNRIASIIQGASCNSSGPHVHFIVDINGTTQNPFNYLSNADYENCSGSSCNSGDGDPFNPSGSWNWPINPKIKFSQGYGNTWAVNHTWVGRIYSFHNGIDINSDSSEVKAVRSGILFRGSYSGSGGCALRYVRIKHNEDGIDTLYLHVNY